MVHDVLRCGGERVASQTHPFEDFSIAITSLLRELCFIPIPSELSTSLLGFGDKREGHVRSSWQRVGLNCFPCPVSVSKTSSLFTLSLHHLHHPSFHHSFPSHTRNHRSTCILRTLLCTALVISLAGSRSSFLDSSYPSIVAVLDGRDRWKNL